MKDDARAAALSEEIEGLCHNFTDRIELAQPTRPLLQALQRICKNFGRQPETRFEQYQTPNQTPTESAVVDVDSLPGGSYLDQQNPVPGTSEVNNRRNISSEGSIHHSSRYSGARSQSFGHSSSNVGPQQPKRVTPGASDPHWRWNEGHNVNNIHGQEQFSPASEIPRANNTRSSSFYGSRHQIAANSGTSSYSSVKPDTNSREHQQATQMTHGASETNLQPNKGDDNENIGQGHVPLVR